MREASCSPAPTPFPCPLYAVSGFQPHPRTPISRSAVTNSGPATLHCCGNVRTDAIHVRPPSASRHLVLDPQRRPSPPPLGSPPFTPPALRLDVQIAGPSLASPPCDRPPGPAAAHVVPFQVQEAAAARVGAPCRVAQHHLVRWPASVVHTHRQWRARSSWGPRAAAGG